jgi:hypothetical protein
VQIAHGLGARRLLPAAPIRPPKWFSDGWFARNENDLAVARQCHPKILLQLTEGSISSHHSASCRSRRYGRFGEGVIVDTSDKLIPRAGADSQKARALRVVAERGPYVKYVALQNLGLNINIRVNQYLWHRKDGGGDERLPLKATPFAILRYLVDHAGRLVTQDELLDAVCPFSKWLFGCQRILQFENRCAAQFTVVSGQSAVPHVVGKLRAGCVNSPSGQRNLATLHAQQAPW